VNGPRPRGLSVPVRGPFGERTYLEVTAGYSGSLVGLGGFPPSPCRRIAVVGGCLRSGGQPAREGV